MIITILIHVFIFFQTKAYAYDELKIASGIVDPDDYNPGSLDDAFTGEDKIVNIGSTIITVIRVVGIIVTVICLMLIGIKYMMGSVEEKADYKKSMIPYFIGVFIFFSLSQILPVIINLVSGMNK